jgi:hypothetical protein
MPLASGEGLCSIIALGDGVEPGDVHAASARPAPTTSVTSTRDGGRVRLGIAPSFRGRSEVDCGSSLVGPSDEAMTSP